MPVLNSSSAVFSAISHRCHREKYFETGKEVRYDAVTELGRDGSYILGPAHAVEGDVPLENMLAFMEETMGQSHYPDDTNTSTRIMAAI